MKRPGVWQGVAFIGSILLLVIYGAWWKQMITNPELRTSTDFVSFYAVARIAQATGLSSIYDIDLQREMEQLAIGVPLTDDRVLLFIHPPQLVPLLSLIIDENYAASFVRWAILLVGTYLVATVYLVHSSFDNDDLLSRFGLIGSVFTFIPLYISIWQGQDTAFLFLGIVFWYIGVRRRHEWLISIGLAFTTIRPHISIVLALPLFFKYPKAFWLSVLAVGILALVNILFLGTAGVTDLLQLIQISAEGEWFGINPSGMLNLLGIVVRGPWSLAPQVISALGWVIFVIGAVFITRLWIHASGIDERLLGLTILIAILTAPHLHLHDLTPLLLPVLIVLRVEHSALRQLPISVPLLGISLFLLAGFITPGLYFIQPYLLCLLLAWRLLRQSQPQEI